MARLENFVLYMYHKYVIIMLKQCYYSANDLPHEKNKHLFCTLLYSSTQNDLYFPDRKKIYITITNATSNLKVTVKSEEKKSQYNLIKKNGRKQKKAKAINPVMPIFPSKHCKTHNKYSKISLMSQLDSKLSLLILNLHKINGECVYVPQIPLIVNVDESTFTYR